MHTTHVRQEADNGPGAGFFDDQSIMHTGGSQLTALKTFLMYFARRFCAFLWYWIIFFAYFGLLYIFEYSLASYSVSCVARIKEPRHTYKSVMSHV